MTYWVDDADGVTTGSGSDRVPIHATIEIQATKPLTFGGQRKYTSPAKSG